MEAFFSSYPSSSSSSSFILLFVIVPLALVYLITIVIFSRTVRRSKNLPPGTSGWPILGETMEFALLGPEKFVKDRMEKHSPQVFQTSLLGGKMAVLCGAQGNKFVFTNESEIFTSWWPQSITRCLFPEYDGKIEEAKPIIHSFQRELFGVHAVKTYVSVMDELAREQMDNEWHPNSNVKVVPLAKKYTFDLACRIFLGQVDPELVKRLADPFTHVVGGMFSLPIDLPGTAYSRAIKASKMVRQELMRIIKERKDHQVMDHENKEGAKGRVANQDPLSKLLLKTDQNGQFVSETNIANFFLGVLVASFDTTSSAVTSVVNYLAQLPHIYDEVLKEQLEIAKSKGPGELLTWEDIEKMKYSWNVARESLRLAPPAQGAFREAKTEFTFAGFTIPKGWKTHWTVSSHMNPTYFPEPEKFDPSRFEGTGPAPYTFVPFGGGPRMCGGKEYARVQILVFMHNLVTRFKLKKAIPNEKVVRHYAAPKPVHGLPVHLQPHEK